MKVVFLNSLKKDLAKITNLKLKEQLKSIILTLEGAASLSELPNLKKMKGHPTAYRIRIGDYRLGLYAEHDTVEIARLVKRNDIYKIFP